MSIALIRDSARPDAVPELVIFDKDGTLIDFNLMWGTWVRDLAARLEAALDAPLAGSLFHAMGYSVATGRVLAEGWLAVTPMAAIRALTHGLITRLGVAPDDAEAALDAGWTIPDPVALAQPLADLPALFARLGRQGTRIAVVTTDDRAPTEATLASLGVAGMVAGLICADDGLAIKPAPDSVLRLCQNLAVDPAHTVVIGDTLADMLMGRRAGVGMTVGVLSGVSSAAELAAQADVVLPSIAALPW